MNPSHLPPDPWLTESSEPDAAASSAQPQGTPDATDARAPRSLKRKQLPRGGTAADTESQRPADQGRRRSGRVKSSQLGEDPAEDPLDAFMIRQPETRPISQEQLVAEVKGIYAGLVMVESKCIEVVNAQNNAPTELNNELWQALIALHRTLLHEHHDFFLASQHPCASPELRRLAVKYAMPARMWRHGVHSFLELLRHRLPGSLEHMLTFIYLAYSIMALMYETAPAFEDTWTECLGDLGRYRMAIEREDIRDRQVWTRVSRHWYSRASDKAPTNGRLHHHLAILARPDAVQQLFYYTKSLTVAVPFTPAKESILTLFEPVMADTQQRPSFDNAFVAVHCVIFIKKSFEELDTSMPYFFSLLDDTVARLTRTWMEPGSYVAISNGNALLGFGDETSPLMKIVASSQQEDCTDVVMDGTASAKAGADVRTAFEKAVKLANKTDEIIFARSGDPNVLPYLHCRLAFMLHLSYHPEAMALLQDSFCWHLMTSMLNSVLDSLPEDKANIDTFDFPRRDTGDRRPLPEDWALRGLLWTDRLFPSDYFDEKVEEENKAFEVPSMTDDRKRRVIYLAHHLQARGDWFSFDENTKRFVVSPAYEKTAGNKILAQEEPDAASLGGGTLYSMTDEDPEKRADAVSIGGMTLHGGTIGHANYDGVSDDDYVMIEDNTHAHDPEVAVETPTASRLGVLEKFFDYIRRSCLVEVSLLLRGETEDFMVHRPDDTDSAFAEIHTHLFTGRYCENLPAVGHRYLSQLREDMSYQAEGWRTTGSLVALSNCNAILEYGIPSNPIVRALGLLQGDDVDAWPLLCGSGLFGDAIALATLTDEIVFARHDDPNVLPYVYVRLAFMRCMVDIPSAKDPGVMEYLQDCFHWRALTQMLNSIIRSLPAGETDSRQPLPEDWLLRGLIWTRCLFPPDHFEGFDDGKGRRAEVPSVTDARMRGILRLASYVAAKGPWFSYNGEERRFVVSPDWDKEPVAFLSPPECAGGCTPMP
ncbi:hypothetical protein NKR23_g10896 [Pleurostoma richardsiae]|uniref:Nonsense-mediated mRNA decay factor n=1 Tax=Pleurostoma richardsiae TaxID=41990 RepID=A0AA38VKT7_9PEZI|nr:hypothetical protein NKR23_g10896 [Pleurostoma richardsiae]